MAALMTCDRDDTTKVAKFIREARSMHIEVLPPDVNFAASEFVATSDSIRFAMSGIKGVGQAVVDMIIEERTKRGPFDSLYGFIQRVDKTRIGKKVIEILIEAGCFDFTKWTRDEMRESVEAMFDRAARDQKEASLGVLNLFALIEQEEKPFASPPTVLQKTGPMQVLQREKELLGFYLTGHPMDSYRHALSRLSCIPFKDIETLNDGAIFRAAFVVETVAIKISSKSQKKFAILNISDGLERFELPVWPEMFEEKGPLIRENQLLYAILQAERKEGSLHLQCRYLDDLTTVDESKIKLCDDQYDRLKAQNRGGEPKWKAAKDKKAAEEKEKEKESSGMVRLKLDADQVRFSSILALKDLFRQHPGKSPLEIHFVGAGKRWGVVQIDSQWGVKADAVFRDKIQQLAAQLGAQVEYS
jgi:DNA polymerase-3 subunit alpha